MVIKPLSDNQVKLRQGQGLGQHIIMQTQAALKKDGIKHIELSARKSAQKFYEKLGCQTKNQAF